MQYTSRVTQTKKTMKKENFLDKLISDTPNEENIYKKIVIIARRARQIEEHRLIDFEEELSNTNKTFVIISHDRYLLGKLTNKIFHIQRGQTETLDCPM